MPHLKPIIFFLQKKCFNFQYSHFFAEKIFLDHIIDAILKCLDFLGAIAQLGERLHGMQEVSGSIPLSSTKYTFSSSTVGWVERFLRNPTQAVLALVKSCYLSPSPFQGEGWDGGAQISI
jgi:hypothetical protein